MIGLSMSSMFTFAFICLCCQSLIEIAGEPFWATCNMLSAGHLSNTWTVCGTKLWSWSISGCVQQRIEWVLGWCGYIGFGRAICTINHSGETQSCSFLCSCLPAMFVEVSTPATDPFSAPPVAWMTTGINNRLTQCQHGAFLLQFMLAQRQLGINSIRKYLDEAAHDSKVWQT